MDASLTKKIAIIGGGASALYLSTLLDSSKYDICIYEKNKTLGRKFLVAGSGGFNLTHSESIDKITKRYNPEGFIDSQLRQYDNENLIKWLEAIGIPTFVGSSKRVFPIKGIKPIEVLQKILNRLTTNQVKWEGEQTWTGWSKNGRPLINDEKEVGADIVIFCLGGASWKVTGSDGKWLPYFYKKKIEITPFQASNCAYEVAWPESFKEKYQGQPLKNISLRIDKKICKGELVVTAQGLEGNALYALSPELRRKTGRSRKAKVYIDLKPTLSIEVVKDKLEKSGKNTTETLKRDLKLSPVMVALVKLLISKEDFVIKPKLAKLIKNLPLELNRAGPIDEAISTVGGIDLSEIDNNLQLKKLPNHYCIGEMLDWDAPTGGYLLQACYSMAAALANHLNKQNLSS